jgi:acetylornithine deacetylase
LISIFPLCLGVSGKSVVENLAARSCEEKGMDSQKQVLDWIEKNRTAIVGFLQDLIRIPSVTGEEGPIQKFIAGRLKEMGLAVDVFEPDLAALRKHPAFVEVSRGYEGRPNVVGILKGKGGGKSLLFNGHVDVIPAGAPESWQHPSWSGDLADAASRRGSGRNQGWRPEHGGHPDCGIRLGGRHPQYTVDEELSRTELACV